MLTKLNIQPGVNREGTDYSAEGYWYNSDKIRFRKGKPEKIGGWTRLSSNTYLGVTRSMHNWSSSNNDNYMGIGTNLKAYIEIGGAYYDITPTRYAFQTTLSEDLTTSAFTFDVADSGIVNGSVLRVGNEYMLVTSIGSGTDLTVANATSARTPQFGTAAAAHSTGDAVFEILKVSNPIHVVNDSSTLLIHDATHGATVGDYITFLSVGSTFSHGVTQANLLTGYDDATSTQGFQISRVLNSDYYEIVVGATGSVGSAATLNGDILAGAASITVSGGALVDDDYVKIDDEYIKLDGDTGSATTFATCLRGQFGSVSVDHSSASNVKELSAASGGDVFILYDIPSSTTSYSGASGFGAGAWAGRPDSFISTEIDTLYDTGSPTTMVLDDRTGFADAGTALVGDDLYTYSSVATNTLSGVVHISGPEINHSPGQTVYSITASWFGWGESATTTTELAQWSLDNFGSDLVLARQNGEPYYWDFDSFTLGSIPILLSGGAGASVNNGIVIGDAVPMDSIGTASQSGHGGVPEQIRRMIVYPERQLVIALGTTSLTDVLRPMLVRWSDATAPGSWLPTEINDAGGIPLSSGSYIVSGCKSKREVLIWTDTSLYAMRHDPAFVFGFSLISEGVSIIGSNAFAEAADVIYWMDDRNFYQYAGGGVGILPCTVLEYVFGDLDYDQREKVFAARNTRFNEVTFFYPSIGSTDIDKYVTYNYSENVWSIGSMARTAWSDSGLREKPEAAYISDTEVSLTYLHENGYDDEGSPITAFVESAYVDIQPDGEYIAFVSRVIPDVRFSGSASGTIDLDVYSQLYPNASASTTSYDDIGSSTEYKDMRVRGRQIAVRIESSDVGSGWHLGDFRYEIRSDGKR
jgi:hypothetical protein